MTLDEAIDFAKDAANFCALHGDPRHAAALRVVLAALPTREQVDEPMSLSESVTHGTVASMVAVVQPSCEHCGQALACPGEQAERIAGLEAMHEQTLDRAERAERELAERLSKASHLTCDIEAMIRACVPGGQTCDPQEVADALREWHTKSAAKALAAREGKCARWPACKWDSGAGKIHTCPICGPECSC